MMYDKQFQLFSAAINEKIGFQKDGYKLEARDYDDDGIYYYLRHPNGNRIRIYIYSEVVQIWKNDTLVKTI